MRQLILRSILLKKFIYIDDDTIFIERKVGKGGAMDAATRTPLKNIRVVVLGKKHYHETVRTFPFTGIKEIESAIATDIYEYSPFDTAVFFLKKVDGKEGEAKVNLWFVEEKTVALLSRFSPLFVIPESLLALFYSKDPGEGWFDIRKSDKETLFIRVERDSTIKSMISQDGKPDFTMFARSAGISGQTSAEIHSRARPIGYQKAYIDHIHEGLYRMPTWVWTRFFNKKTFSIVSVKKQFAVFMAAVVSLLVLYVGVSFYLPFHGRELLEQENLRLSDEMADIEKKKTALDHLISSQRMLAERVDQYSSRVKLINVIKEMILGKCILQRLIASGSSVEIWGVAPKASEVLSLLSDEKRIVSARFMAPLRQNKKDNTEFFKISFVWSP